MLYQKMFFTKIAEITVVSKSCIGRHSLNCVPRIKTEKIRFAKDRTGKHRLIVSGVCGDATLRIFFDPANPHHNAVRDGQPIAHLQPQDLWYEVCYAKQKPPRILKTETEAEKTEA